MTVEERIQDHEDRIRSLEKQRATDERLLALEKDVGNLKITVARLAVIYGVISALGSAFGAGLVTLVLRGLL